MLLVLKNIPHKMHCVPSLLVCPVLWALTLTLGGGPIPRLPEEPEGPASSGLNALLSSHTAGRLTGVFCRLSVLAEWMECEAGAVSVIEGDRGDRTGGRAMVILPVLTEWLFVGIEVG